jgi:hypothetical protein
LKPAEAELGQICRQDDDCETVSEAARSARAVQQENVRRFSHKGFSLELTRLLFSQLAEVTV